jgi:hypothetical protein
MPPHRRDFLIASAASLLALLDVSPVAAAGATRSNLFVSEWTIRKIVLQLALGVFKELEGALKPDALAEAIASGQFQTDIEMLSKEAGQFGKIKVHIDNFHVQFDGAPQPGEHEKEKREQIAKSLFDFVQGELRGGTQNEKGDFHQRLHKAFAEVIPELRQIVPAEVRISYDLHADKLNVTLHKTVLIRHGRVRIEASLPQGVGQLNSLLFVIDAEEKGNRTYITTILGLDVCIGRREGPLVRRIAGRVIGGIECDLLCRLETVVYNAIHYPEHSDDLTRIMGEVIHLVATQQF